MELIKILVIDDSSVVRRLLSDVLSSDPALEVVATAADGRAGLAKIEQVNPDVLVLDVEMPVLDGLSTLLELRKKRPKLPIVMYSASTEEGATATIEALARGANDFVTKPSNTGSREQSMEHIRSQLIPKIKNHVASARDPFAAAGLAGGALARLASPKAPLERIDVIGIGASAGGPAVLAQLLAGLPSAMPVPVIVVQHMPPLFTRILAERLAKDCPLPVREVVSGVELQAGHVWVAPGGLHTAVIRQNKSIRMVTQDGGVEHTVRPSVDVLLRSLAAVFAQHTLALILTGMGRDGVDGCAHIKEAKGRVLVQDAASSVVWGMPSAVAAAGLADGILSPAQLSTEICDAVQIGRKARSTP